MTSKFCREGLHVCRQLHWRPLSVSSALKTNSLTGSACRTYASAAAAKINDEAEEQRYPGNHIAKSPLGAQAQQKEADRVSRDQFRLCDILTLPGILRRLTQLCSYKTRRQSISHTIEEPYKDKVSTYEVEPVCERILCQPWQPVPGE